MRLAPLTLLVACTLARADGGATTITLAAGATLEREVGFAQGATCDDATIARAEMRAHTADSNTFVLTAVAPGTTLCRAGTVPTRPAFLFDVHVTAALPRR